MAGYRRSPVAKSHQPGACRDESAGLVVERIEARLEIDMEPLAPGGRRVRRREADKLTSDAASLVSGRTFVSSRKAWLPPSQATFTKPMSAP
jgi:hypothetical protein